MPSACKVPVKILGLALATVKELLSNVVPSTIKLLFKSVLPSILTGPVKLLVLLAAIVKELLSHAAPATKRLPS